MAHISKKSLMAAKIIQSSSSDDSCIPGALALAPWASGRTCVLVTRQRDSTLLGVLEMQR